MRKILLIPTLITTSLIPLISFSACNNEKIDLDPVEFKTCSWSIIAQRCEFLENGKISEQQFCNSFLIDTKPATSLADFVAVERIITINGWDHIVMVVGCKKDFLDEQKTKPVAFTFQFKNLISMSESGLDLRVRWDADHTQKGNKDYWHSSLFNVLNSPDEVVWKNTPKEKRSVFHMISDADSALANSIKDVYRDVIVYNSELTSELKYELKGQKTKIFCPTLANLFSHAGITSSKSLITDKEQQDLYCGEGQQYDFFALEGNINDDPVDDTVKYQCLQRENFQQIPLSFYYWLTSPVILLEGDYQITSSWAISHENCINIHFVDDEIAVAPCFGI